MPQRSNATGERRLTRRYILRGAAAGIASAGFAPLARRSFAAGGLDVTSLGDGFAVIGGAGGNILVAPSDDGTVLVDTGNAASVSAVRETLTELSAAPVTAVFNTHWHPDQVGGNAAFGRDGAVIVAHAKTRQRLSSGYYRREQETYVEPLPAAGLPTETFHTEDSRRIGSTQIDSGYLLQAHTDGDIYVRFPDANLVAVGDVLAPVRDPSFDWFGGGWLGGRVDSLALLLEATDADTRFVPATGPVVGRAELEAEHDTMLAFFELMVEQVRLGLTARDIHESGVLATIGRDFDDPYQLLYDTHKGFWAHHNKLMPDIV